MLYYSLAYYLWKMCYDVWLVNYRGTGCGLLKSEVGSKYTSLDVWAIYRNGVNGYKNSETVLGVIAIDPAMIPPLPRLLDTKLGWILLDYPMYIDLRRWRELVRDLTFVNPNNLNTIRATSS